MTTLPFWQQQQQLMLQLCCRSMIEAYALGGRARVTSRIYPTDFKSDWGVATYGPSTASASMDVWAVDSMWSSTPAMSMA